MAIVEIFKKKVLWARCNRCGHEWITRLRRAPKSCPECKTRLTLADKKRKKEEEKHQTPPDA